MRDKRFVDFKEPESGAEAGASELKAMLDLLANVANKDNWGYFDPSGCPKGMGRYKDSWIGDGEHPLDAAERLLAAMKSNAQ